MELIIKLPSWVYESVKNGTFDAKRSPYDLEYVLKYGYPLPAKHGWLNDCVTVIKALEKATPIPDNATNGEVLISLYPNLKYTIQNGRVITTIGVASSFDLDWWNDKYKVESEDK